MSAALPVRVDLTAYRGDTWAQTFRLLRGADPVDLSGATVESEARDPRGGVFALAVEVDGPAGEVTLRLPEGSLPPNAYAYDLEVTDGGGVTTWVRGGLNVTRDVTNELPEGTP